MENNNHECLQEVNKTLEAYEAPEINCLNSGETESGGVTLPPENTMYSS
ncbi:MAG: hypothetical protein PHV59_02330 [Victivallales bacterium]|nr:hypothetical protein [Victivallales bacterium]